MSNLPKTQFPSILRFITEIVLSGNKKTELFKRSLIGLVFILLLIATMLQTLLLLKNYGQLKKIIIERKNIEREINYWTKEAEKYQNYSDIYLKIASLEYRLGNAQIAKSFVDKALALNQDREQGKVLGDKISRK